MALALRRWTTNVDHYYWLTALLSARGAQTKVCLLIAATMAALGVIPLILLVNTAGPQGARNQILALAVSVLALSMAALWLRKSWPSRRQSQLCSVGGAVCVSVACLVAADPAIAFFGCTTFAVLSAYISYFHGDALLAFNWTIGAATLAVVAVRMAVHNTAFAIAGVVVVVLLNVFAAFTCRTIVRLVASDISHDQIEPLTGLLNRDAFYDQVATLIGARSRGDDRFLVVVVVSIDSYSLLTSFAGAAGTNRARVAVAQQLRETARVDALIAHVGGVEFFIAELFTMADPSPLIERIRGTITSPPARLSASIGAVSTPLRPLVSSPPYESLDEILAIATTAMYEARRAGGNQARLIVNPEITVLDEPDGGNRVDG